MVRPVTVGNGGKAEVGPVRPRLLFVVNEFYFFYTHRLPIAQAARDAGYEVHIAAPESPGWAPQDFDLETLRREGFHLHPIPLQRRGVNPLEEVLTFNAILRLYRRLGPALVHHLTIKPVLYGSMAARICRVPAVINAITGLGQVFVAHGARAAVLRWGVRIAYRLALTGRNTWVIVQNPDDGERLIEMRAVAPERLVLIRGSGVDLQRFTSRPEAPGVPMIVLPARLIWEKGIAEFVEAARSLKAEGRDARFVLLGNTIQENPRAVPETQLREWCEEGVVEWWGYRADMPEILSDSHIVCLPSRYGEGVPKILIEAAACGRVSVTSDIPGCRDIVRDGVNGLVVPPGDVDALTAALRRLIDDAGERRKMGSAGRDIVAREFSLTSVVGQTLAIYRQLQRV